MGSINDIIEDVGDALKLSDGCELGEKDRKKIIKGIKRLLDRFSIDARKLPTVCQVEHKIQLPDNRLTVGKGQRFNLWGKPVAIHYAAWKGCHADCCTYITNAGTTLTAGGLCEQPIRINLDVGQFHMYSTCRDIGCSRPTEMFYQRGEIVFNSRPFVGDTLILRAVMPFDDQLSDCCKKDECEEPEYEFTICPEHMLDMNNKEEILCMARQDFDGDPCWEGHYCAHPCGDECVPPVNVVVKPVKKSDICPVTVEVGDMDMPEGYHDAMVRILTYDLAPQSSISRDVFMRQDRDDAVKILQRANSRPLPHQKDLTTYWSRPCYPCDGYNIKSQTPRGGCH